MGLPEKPDATRFYPELVANVLIDTAASLKVSKSSLQRDLITLQRRWKSEGEVFLTKTLPALGKSLDKALSSGDAFSWTSFEKSKKSGLPLFLSGFWKCIFDNQGYLRQDLPELRQVEAVRAVRQVCYLLYKLEGAHSPESELEVIETFVRTDSELPGIGADLHLSPAAAATLENARMLIWHVVKGLDLLNIVPKHGPGVVATGEKPWDKMSFKRLYESIDEVYPFVDYYFFNYTHLCDSLEELELLQVMPFPTAKVCLVPKDSRGPRLISIEPLEVQWIQQGQMAALVERLERHPATSGHVNFTSQEINRTLALLNSNDGDFVTLDMKEASDRVSVWLVDALFPEDVKRCLLATRSTSTVLPDGRTLSLKKFAPMGSSVCFPVEALIFWALCVGSSRHVDGRRNPCGVPHVYVYGDDLVVPRGMLDSILTTLPEFHLEFNLAKCCTGRFFRESCGMDAFRKHPVTPIRVKKRIDDASPAAMLGYLSYYNSFKAKGYTRTAELLLSSCGRLRSMPFTNNPECYGLLDEGLTDGQVQRAAFTRHKNRWNSDLQRYEVRIWSPTTRDILRGEPDWKELQRAFSLGLPNGGLSDSFVPNRHVVPHQIKMRWVWKDISSLLRRR